MTEWFHFHFSLSCIGEGNGNPLQCSCLENPRDGGAWWAAVYGVAQSRTRLKRLSILIPEASQVVLVVKNLPASVGDEREVSSIPGSGRSPGGGHGNPVQYSCLENPIDRAAWRATVHGVAKSQTQLKWLSMHTHLIPITHTLFEDTLFLNLTRCIQRIFSSSEKVATKWNVRLILMGRM